MAVAWPDARQSGRRQPGLDLHQVPSHSRAASATGLGNVASSPDGSYAGNGSVPVTVQSGAAVRREASTTESTTGAADRCERTSVGEQNRHQQH